VIWISDEIHLSGHPVAGIRNPDRNGWGRPSRPSRTTAFTRPAQSRGPATRWNPRPRARRRQARHSCYRRCAERRERRPAVEVMLGRSEAFTRFRHPVPARMW
jgi:hypothetical protein